MSGFYVVAETPTEGALTFRIPLLVRSRCYNSWAVNVTFGNTPVRPWSTFTTGCYGLLVSSCDATAEAFRIRLEDDEAPRIVNRDAKAAEQTAAEVPCQAARSE